MSDIDDFDIMPSNSHDIEELLTIRNSKEDIDVDSSDENHDCQLNSNQEINEKTKGGAKNKKAYEDISKLDENVREVALRLQKGCECQEQNCFDGFDSEAVYKHRLNIDELSKLEHDMYLMGITMACMESPDETNRHKERKRLRAKYRFKGQDVCLSAFLYLEHTTLHQLKSIRKHVKNHGVTPRVHGNHRKKPHNAFSLDIYQHATQFIQAYVEKHSLKEPSAKKKGLILLSDKMTCKKIHSDYKAFSLLDPGSSIKVMGYSTFRHFLKDQFPNVRFHKDDVAKNNGESKTSNNPSLVTRLNVQKR